MNEFFSSLNSLDYLVLACNLLLIVSARRIIKALSDSEETTPTFVMQLALLRAVNVLILLIYGYFHGYLLLGENTNEKSHIIVIKVVGIMSIIYFAYLSNDIIDHWISRRYGKKRQIAGQTQYIATYQTRSLTILAKVFIFIIAAVACIQQLGFDSLLEAGGLLGIIGVILALTQASWAPDIISGLICLNSNIFEEGDVIEIPTGIIGLVYKTKMFHTEILNLTNNHRIMIRNSQLRDVIIHNLSKFASAKGLRECLAFNIGYDVDVDEVKALFEKATEIAIKSGLPFESQHTPDVKVLETADHAICWGFIFYLKKTEKLVNIRRDFKEIILKTSQEMQISLATPLTHVNQIERKPKSVK